MEPERNPALSSTTTLDLLAWPDNPHLQSPPITSTVLRPTGRHNQPPAAISPVMFGGPMTAEEAESVLKRKPCSEPKFKEMSGSGIFAAYSENGESELGTPFLTPNRKTGVRTYQHAVSVGSQISFGAEEIVSPRKPTSLAEVAKQRELSGNLSIESESKLNKQLSNAKRKELSGHDIFGPPQDVQPSPLGPRNLEMRGIIQLGEPLSPIPQSSSDVSSILRTPISKEPAMKTAKKIPYQKVAELAGNDIFEDNVPPGSPEKSLSVLKLREINGNDIFKDNVPPGSAEKSLSVLKLREINGSDIFADGKVEHKDHFGGVRKPPGGESSIALV